MEDCCSLATCYSPSGSAAVLNVVWLWHGVLTLLQQSSVSSIKLIRVLVKYWLIIFHVWALTRVMVWKLWFPLVISFHLILIWGTNIYIYLILTFEMGSLSWLSQRQESGICIKHYIKWFVVAVGFSRMRAICFLHRNLWFLLLGLWIAFMLHSHRRNANATEKLYFDYRWR